MPTTRYFNEQVLRKRTYLTVELCTVIANPISREVQPDDRIRHWGEVTLPDDPTTRILRVVTLEDGETIHIAFSTEAFARTRHEAALLSGDGQPLHRTA